MLKNIFESHIVNTRKSTGSFQDVSHKIQDQQLVKENPKPKNAKKCLLHTQIYNTNITLITAARKDRKEKRITR